MTLCTLCEGFARSIGGEYHGDYYLHQPSFDALRHSSHHCELCRLIIDQLEESGQTTSIIEASQDDYPTTITFVGVDRNGPWKYYPDYQDKNVWEGLVGLRVCCGDAERNDDWGVEFALVTDPG
jgi:hypothetical protein